MNAHTEAIAASLEALLDVDQVYPHRPGNLHARTAFVTPAVPWKERDTDRYCGWSVGYEVMLVSSAADDPGALTWLDEQTNLVLGDAKIEVGTDWVEATEIDAPILLTTDEGSRFLACRIAYSKLQEGE